MKRNALFIHCLVFTMAFMLFALTATAGETEKQPAPEAVYPEKAFNFDPVLEGTEVSHAFVVQNKGTAELQIQRVKTG